MSNQTSYDMSDEDLMKKLLTAAGRAGFSNSGLVMSGGAGSDIEELHYLKGCMFARLDNAKPEIQPGSKATFTQKDRCERCGLDGFSWQVPELKKGTDYTVRRVWYFKKAWYLELKGQSKHEGGTALYRADQFAITAPEPVAS